MFCMRRALVVTIREVQMGNLTVDSTDSHSFASSFSFPLIQISKTHTKKRICSGFFCRKYNAFKEPDHQPYSFGFSRRRSADLHIKVTQPIAVSQANLCQTRSWLPQLNEVCLIVDSTVRVHVSTLKQLAKSGPRGKDTADTRRSSGASLSKRGREIPL